MRRLFGLIFCTSFVLCGSLGCNLSPMEEGEKAVRRYCQAVIVAHRTHDITPLRPVTTSKELRKLIALLDMKNASGLVLESSLEALEVTGVEKPSPAMMTVNSTERWRYFDRPLDVGRPPGTEFVVEMDLEYTFIQEDGVWRMDHAQTRRHEYLEPEGYSHQQDDPHGARHGEVS